MGVAVNATLKKKNPLTLTDFFFSSSNEMLLSLVHIRANVVAYLCFQFQHVALAI